MNEKQTRLKAFLSTGSGRDVTASLPDGDNIVTHTAHEWLVIGDTQALITIVNAPQTLGLTVPNTAASKADVVNAVASGDEYNVSTVSGFLLEVGNLSGDIMDLSNAIGLANMRKLLAPYNHGSTSCLAKFNELLVRPATSIADYFGGVGMEDIYAIVAPG
jgi:hypothetical protein